jgi:hypothetical protein
MRRPITRPTIALATTLRRPLDRIEASAVQDTGHRITHRIEYSLRIE